MSINNTSGDSQTRPHYERTDTGRGLAPNVNTEELRYLSLPPPREVHIPPSQLPDTHQPPPPPLPPPRETHIPPSQMPPGHDQGLPEQERPCTRWVIWEVWHTERDERVCPECGPLDRQWFKRGEGPVAPLHSGCRCRRIEIWRECVSRDPQQGY